MGSLNDYYWHDTSKKRSRKPGLRLWGFWLQLALAVVLVVGVAASIGGEGPLGQASRYIVSEGLDAGNSWLSFGQRTEEAEGPLAEQPVVAASAGTGISFIAPASGVVVKNMVLDAAGFSTDQGIMIQGVAGQSVKSTAGGEVLYLGESESGFIVEVGHSQGFTSVYQGLSELSVGAGQTLTAGQVLGLTESGELLFSLFRDGEEVDPLTYLFQQEV